MLSQYVALKLVFRTDLGGYWSTSREVNDWNRLGGHVVSAQSIGTFKTCFQDRPSSGGSRKLFWGGAELCMSKWVASEVNQNSWWISNVNNLKSILRLFSKPY